MSEFTVIRETCREISVEWKINSFLDLTYATDYHLESTSFFFNDAEWFIQIYPNGEMEKMSCGWIGMYLAKQPSLNNHNISYTFEIKKTNGFVFKSSSHKRFFNTELCGFGRSRFLTPRHLCRGDALVVYCKIFLIDRCFTESTTQTLLSQGDGTLSQDFKKLFISGCESDVTLKVKNKEFKAHKIILSSRSLVFQSMFQVDMKENNDGIVDIEDCEPDIFYSFLQFLYCGELDALSWSWAVQLYILADKYDVKLLREICYEFLVGQISLDSICDVVKLAIVHNECRLLKPATEFFICYIDQILTTPNWISFLTDHPIIANELLLQMVNECKNNSETDN